MKLPAYGVWTSYRQIGTDNAGAAAKLAEELGFGAFWLGGSPEFGEVAPLLEATESLLAITGIINIWSTDPGAVARDRVALERDFPGRAIAGIGVGHPEATSDYARPLKAMREYLDGLDAADPAVPADARLIAALGPKMTDLSGERSLGTHPYFSPVEHTRFARRRLGPDALVAPELTCVVDDDVERARAAGRAFAKRYLALTNYTSNLLRFGFTQDDIADGGSDRLIDAIVPHGTAEQVAAAAGAHLDAGADHVCLQPVGADGVPEAQWRALAGALGLS